MDTFPFKIALKPINYLRINTNKDFKDSYNENFKPLKD